MDEIELQLEESKLQLEETKLQLSDKLGTLEQQVSQTVETASTAVAATVEAVQGTVESVTGAVEDAVHGMHDAFDLHRQIRKHPFLVLGGAAVVGYVAAQYFKSPARRLPAVAPATTYGSSNAPYSVAQPSGYAATNQPVARQFTQNQHPSHWDGLKTLALSTLFGTMQGIALRAIPEVVGLVVGNVLGQPSLHPQPTESVERPAPRARIWPEEAQPYSQSTLSEQVRSSKLS
eukprot:TRINITY_DN843_c0_g1_i1.p1 TRINITY_DN843_c0_g1~~TRINITY_DN843_c0_g1_i1.p1  ORF type:complete len:233 (+),score=40.74 TRINITY_DN843_c0_g1_i1:229-927(+)